MKFITGKDEFPLYSAKRKLKVSDYRDVLISDYHTSEGFLVKTNDGNILHILREVPFSDGGHIDNRARIVCMKSDDDGITWGQPVEIHNTIYDDRNVHGGITQDGRVVCFFREYNGDNNSTIATRILYSDDNGVNWNTIDTDLSPTFVAGLNKMDYLPNENKYIISTYDTNYVGLTKSDDGINWSTVHSMYDYRISRQVGVSEPTIAHIGGDNVLSLIRIEEGKKMYDTLVVGYSTDNGNTWSDLYRTNMPFPHWGSAPQIIYDEENDLVIAMVGTRKDLSKSGTSEDDKLFIYTNTPERAMKYPKSWNLEVALPRPDLPFHDGWTNNFYGYPTFTKIDVDKYLVVFTDSDASGLGTRANIWGFDIEIL